MVSINEYVFSVQFIIIGTLPLKFEHETRFELSWLKMTGMDPNDRSEFYSRYPFV